MKASVILVNYNGGAGVVENLRLLRGEISGGDAEIIVVDNASSDGSIERIREGVPDACLIVEEVNRGYAAGVNRGLAEARGSVLVVLNPDLRPRPGAVGRLVEAALEHSEFALLGGLLVDGRGKPNRNCSRALPRLSDILREAVFLPPRRSRGPRGPGKPNGRIVETEVISGAAMALSREWLEKLGPMDEEFFLYREDVEWCRRAGLSSARVGLVPDAVFVHEGGASTSQAEGPSFAARVLSDFRYFCTLEGVPERVVRSRWLLRLRIRSLIYALDAWLGILGRRPSSGRRSALYRVLADELRAFRWSEPEGSQSCHPSRLVDLPAGPLRDEDDGRPTVLMVTPDMSYGGAQRRIEYLVDGPLAREFRFEILCLRSAGAVGERLRDRVRIHTIGVGRWTSLSTWRRVADYCALLAPDLVQSTTLPADVAGYVGFRRRTPRMSIKVSIDTWMTPPLRLVERTVLRDCRLICANGDETARAKSHLARDGMLPLAIPNPPMIDIADEAPRPFPVGGPVRLAVLGRLEKVKRVGTFLLMASELEKSSPGKYSYRVLGGGRERASLERAARDLGLGDRVEFEGPVDDVASALDEVDIVLLFSEGDGNPFTVQETIARGRVPIVRHAGGAVNSLPDALSDCFVHSSSPSAFAAKVEEVVERSDDVLTRVHEAKAHVRDRRRFFETAMRTAYMHALGRRPRGGRTRVLHLITRLIVGGAQENTIASVARVDPDRYESHLWIGPQTGSEGSLIADARARGIVVRVLPHLVREINPPKDIAVTLELRRLLARERFDVVHTHSSKAGIVGRIAAKLAGVPHIVHTVHGWGFHEHMNPLLRASYVTLERLLEPWTRPLISVSERTTRVGLEEGIGDASTYRLIRSGIPLDLFRPEPERGAALREALGIPRADVVVGSVGRLSPQKNPLDFVRVAARLSEHRRDLTFLYVGDGPLREIVEEAIHRAGLADRIRLLGIRDDVPDLLRAMDLFALTSLWEGLPRVVPQALASGVPVVAYDVAGIEEAVREGRNGHLVPPGAVDQMVERFLPLVQDAGLRSEMSHRAVDEFDRGFSEDAMIADLEDLYDELAGPFRL